MEEVSNFDKNIKTILDSRTFKPKAKVWINIEERLEKNRRKQSYIRWSTAVAAVFVLGLILPNLFNNNTINNNESFILSKGTANDVKIIVDSHNDLIKNPIAETEESNKSMSTFSKLEINKSRVANTNDINEKNKIEEGVALISSNENTLQELVFESTASEEKKLVLEEEQLILHQDKVDIAYNIDHEIESLLNQANLSIEVEDVLNSESLLSSQEDVDQLLLEAEESIGQSFRTKVFHLVKNSFKDIKKGVVLNK